MCDKAYGAGTTERTVDELDGLRLEHPDRYSAEKIKEVLTNPNSCMSKARDDEMTFVLLARDAAAPFAIRAWCVERIRLGKNSGWDDPQIAEAMASNP